MRLPVEMPDSAIEAVIGHRAQEILAVTGFLSWARAEAKSEIYREWLDGLPQQERVIPDPGHARQESPVVTWQRLSGRARELRRALRDRLADQPECNALDGVIRRQV